MNEIEPDACPHCEAQSRAAFFCSQKCLDKMRDDQEALIQNLMFGRESKNCFHCRQLVDAGNYLLTCEIGGEWSWKFCLACVEHAKAHLSQLETLQTLQGEGKEFRLYQISTECNTEPMNLVDTA